MVEHGKIELDFDDLPGRIAMSRNFIPASLNFNVLQMLPEIPLNVLHDRIIVATAKILDARLITKDKLIRESGLVEVL